MDKFFASRHLLVLIGHRTSVIVAALVVGGLLASWSIVQPFSPLAIAAWLLVLAGLAASTWMWLKASERLLAQTTNRREAEHQLALQVESNIALKTAHQELTQQKWLAENMLTVVRAASHQPVMQPMLQNVLDIAATLTDTVHGSLFLLNPEGRVWQHLYTRQTMSPPTSDQLIGRVLRDGLAGWAIRHRKLAVSQDTSQDPHWIELPNRALLARSAVAVPFTSRGSVIGILTLTHPQPNHFSEAHQRLLSDAADHIAIILDNVKLFHTMMQMTDRLGLLYKLHNLTSGTEPDAILAQFIHAIHQATRWPSLAVFLRDPDSTPASSRLIKRASIGDSLPERLAPDDPLLSGVSCNNEPVLGRDSDNGQLLVASVCTDQDLLGVLLAKGSPTHSFGVEDKELLSSAAGILAATIVSAQLRQRLEALTHHSPDLA